MEQRVQSLPMPFSGRSFVKRPLREHKPMTDFRINFYTVRHLGIAQPISEYLPV